MESTDTSKRRPKSGKVLLLRWAGILLFLLSPVAIYYATVYYLEGSDMANWPQAEGTVTSHSVYERTAQGQVKYSVYIIYTFEAEGRSYKGERAKPGSNEMFAAEKDALIARYPVGSRHRVYYAPSDPERTYLEPGVDEQALTRAVIAWLLPVAGLVLFALSLPPPENADSTGAKWARLGTWLMDVCLTCLVIGGIAVRVLFSDMRGKGIPTAAFFVLIPIWTTGVVGLVIWIIGKLRG